MLGYEIFIKMLLQKTMVLMEIWEVTLYALHIRNDFNNSDELEV
jgi:hypothetical protein